MLQPINFAKRNLSYACAYKNLAVLPHEVWSFSKVCKTCTTKASEAYRSSQTSQLICELCYCSLLLGQTLLANANACFQLLLVCCGWLLLYALVDCCICDKTKLFIYKHIYIYIYIYIYFFFFFFFFFFSYSDLHDFHGLHHKSHTNIGEIYIYIYIYVYG